MHYSLQALADLVETGQAQQVETSGAKRCHHAGGHCRCSGDCLPGAVCPETSASSLTKRTTPDALLRLIR
jgi:hypothetical protein